MKSSQQHGHPKFYEFLKEMADIHSRKNHDYAGTQDPLCNLRASERFGIPAWKGILVRIQDKMSRLENFAKQETLEVSDESVADTLIDLANYAILCRIVFEEETK